MDLLDGSGFAPRMHIVCKGPPAAGRATFILEAGGGSPGVAYAGIVDELASARRRACWYDRLGFGHSDAPRAPPAANQRAAALASLLAAAGEAPPYVIAGHSMGGQLAMLFAAAYPSQVGARQARARACRCSAVRGGGQPAMAARRARRGGSTTQVSLPAGRAQQSPLHPHPRDASTLPTRVLAPRTRNLRVQPGAGPAYARPPSAAPRSPQVAGVALLDSYDNVAISLVYAGSSNTSATLPSGRAVTRPALTHLGRGTLALVDVMRGVTPLAWARFITAGHDAGYPYLGAYNAAYGGNKAWQARGAARHGACGGRMPRAAVAGAAAPPAVLCCARQAHACFPLPQHPPLARNMPLTHPPPPRIPLHRPSTTRSRPPSRAAPI